MEPRETKSGNEGIGAWSILIMRWPGAEVKGVVEFPLHGQGSAPWEPR